MPDQGSRFVVDLGDFKLPALVEKQVESEIRATVLRALAESGFGGDLRAPHGRVSNPIWDQFPGQTLGLWPGWPNQPPIFSGPGGSEVGGTLQVGDHTLIMRAIMENPRQVLRYLPGKFKVKNGPRPTGSEVLQAALQVDQIDDYAKSRIQKVLEILPEIEARQASLPESVKRSVDELREQLANKTVAEKRAILRDPGVRSRHREGGLAEGMEYAARMLEDGESSIYSPDSSFYRMLQDGKPFSRAAARDAISDIGSMDTIGATAGGAIGSVAGGVGAGPGAVAGGAGASAGAAVVHLVDWVISWF